MTKNKAQVLKTIAAIVAQMDSEKEVENFLRAFMTPKECDTLCDRYLLISERPSTKHAALMLLASRGRWIFHVLS